jgi:hypothetical protein
MSLYQPFFTSYAASCHVVELFAIAVQVSDVSEIGDQDSDVSGTAPHPNPIIVPTDELVCTPIIATETTLVAVPAEPVPSTPVISWNEMTSADKVPTPPVALLPVIIGDTKRDWTEPVAELPVMPIETDRLTVPTLPVAIVPSSWIDRLASNVPMADVDELPLMTTLPMPNTPLP